MFIATLFTIAKLWKQPRCPLLMNGLRKCGIYTQWNFTQSQRRMKFCHLQVNRWNWRTSSSEVNQAQKAKVTCFLSYAEYRLETKQ
jgi:hypothetical protein